MTRFCYDSVNIGSIPTNIPDNALVAYYLNGRFAVKSVAAVEALFPGHRLVPIDVNGTRSDYARALDVELGDVAPEQCELWLSQFEAHNPGYSGGARGLIYCNRSTIAAVRAGTGKYRLGVDYTLWVATGDGTIVDVVDGVANSVSMCQYLWTAKYDKSVVIANDFLPS
jgi:hypothetical protein